METQIIDKILNEAVVLYNQLPIISKIGVLVLLIGWFFTKKIRKSMINKFIAYYKRKFNNSPVSQKDLYYHDLFINKDNYLNKAKQSNYSDEDRRFVFTTILTEKIKAINHVAKKILDENKDINSIDSNKFKSILLESVDSIVEEYNRNIKSVLILRYSNGECLYEIVMNKKDKGDGKVGFNVWHEYMVDDIKMIIKDYLFSTTLNSYSDNCEILNDYFKELDRASRFAIFHCAKIYYNFNGDFDRLVKK